MALRRLSPLVLRLQGVACQASDFRFTRQPCYQPRLKFEKEIGEEKRTSGVPAPSQFPLFQIFSGVQDGYICIYAITIHLCVQTSCSDYGCVWSWECWPSELDFLDKKSFIAWYALTVIVHSGREVVFFGVYV